MRTLFTLLLFQTCKEHAASCSSWLANGICFDVDMVAYASTWSDVAPCNICICKQLWTFTGNGSCEQLWTFTRNGQSAIVDNCQSKIQSVVFGSSGECSQGAAVVSKCGRSHGTANPQLLTIVCQANFSRLCL